MLDYTNGGALRTIAKSCHVTSVRGGEEGGVPGARHATSAALKAAEAPRPEAAGRAARKGPVPIRKGKNVKCIYQVPSHATVAEFLRYRRRSSTVSTTMIGRYAASVV